jgi:uncharacterized membrane protein
MSTGAGIALFGESITVMRAAGILLVVGGIALIVTGQREGGAETSRARRHGVWLVLAAAVAWTVGSVMLKPPLQVVSPVTATAIRSPLVGVALWLTPWARGTWQAVWLTRGREAVILAAVCLFSAASPSVTFGIKHASRPSVRCCPPPISLVVLWRYDLTHDPERDDRAGNRPGDRKRAIGAAGGGRGRQMVNEPGDELTIGSAARLSAMMRRWALGKVSNGR